MSSIHFKFEIVYYKTRKMVFKKTASQLFQSSFYAQTNQRNRICGSRYSIGANFFSLKPNQTAPVHICINSMESNEKEKKHMCSANELQSLVSFCCGAASFFRKKDSLFELNSKRDISGSQYQYAYSRGINVTRKRATAHRTIESFLHIMCRNISSPFSTFEVDWHFEVAFDELCWCWSWMQCVAI